MDQKLFEQLLTEVAEWHKITDCSGPGRRGRPRRRDLAAVNPTLGLEITRLKIKNTACQDCGLDCPQGRTLDIRIYQNSNGTHYRQRCLACGMVLDPYTGEFNLDVLKGSQKWQSWIREVKTRHGPRKTHTDK